jgi:hypothetical protein
MSTTNNMDTTKLIVTAIGAAITGATIAMVAMKYTHVLSQDQLSSTSNKKKNSEYLQYHIPASQRNSLVFDESLSENGQKILLPHNHEEKMRRTIAARALVEEDNFHPRDSVTVRVPATSANMGPGCT